MKQIVLLLIMTTLPAQAQWNFWHGLNNQKYKKSCQELKLAGFNSSGKFVIDPDGVGGNPPFEVYCDQETDGGGWTMVLNAVANNNTYGWNNTFWNDQTLLNQTNFTGLVQAKYSSFNLVAGSSIMMKSYRGSASIPPVILKGSIGGVKTFYQVMQESQLNTVIGEIRINAYVLSTHAPYGYNYSRIAANSGNAYYWNIGYGNHQEFGCSDTSGPFGVNNGYCVSCVTNKGLYNAACMGDADKWNAEMFIR